MLIKLVSRLKDKAQSVRISKDEFLVGSRSGRAVHPVPPTPEAPPRSDKGIRLTRLGKLILSPLHEDGRIVK